MAQAAIVWSATMNEPESPAKIRLVSVLEILEDAEGHRLLTPYMCEQVADAIEAIAAEVMLKGKSK
jgi:hypothetical protein